MRRPIVSVVYRCTLRVNGSGAQELNKKKKNKKENESSHE